MVAVRRRGEADARAVRDQKERMTIAAETRELNPGRPRERVSSEEERRGRGLEKGVRERGDPGGEERANDRARRGTEAVFF